MRLRRQYRRGAHESLWMQKDRNTNEKRYASRPCPEACEVCGATPTKNGRRPLDFDHCHREGLFRGWLCHSCNMAVGYVGDNSERLRKLADYLDNFNLLQ
jgi:hypothetical protein